VILWAAGQINWGIYADAFENRGKATINDIQNANYIFFVINFGSLIWGIYCQKLSATLPFDQPDKVKKR
jgi:hypothetical protein